MIEIINYSRVYLRELISFSQAVTAILANKVSCFSLYYTGCYL